MADYTRVQNDTGPPIRDTLKTDGTADDLSGATVAFTLWDQSDDSVIVDENTANVTIEDAANGEVRYDFQSGDLSATGWYHFEWEVTFSDGTIITYRDGDGSPKSLRVNTEGA